MESIISLLEKNDAKKHFFGETRRVCSPEKTLDHVKKFFPIFGITRIANVTGLDNLGIPVYVACRPNSRSLSVSQGKGYTHAAAQASAIMESVESYHAETIDRPLKLCSQNELYYKANCIDTSALPKQEGLTFHGNSRILWIEGEDLTIHEKKWVPFESVHIDYRAPLPTGHGYFISSSNGLSSGNNHLESIIHGICEIVERDALTLWGISPEDKQISTKIALNTINSKKITDLISKFLDANINIGIWDMTSDIGIPAFLCRILPNVSSDISGIRPASGMGCHLSKEIALLRAVTEAAQSRLTFISGARDDMSREDYKKFLAVDEYQKWHDAITHKGHHDYSTILDVETDTLSQDLDVLLQSLKRRGISEVVVVDLTKEEFNIPVTRVIIPGLESFISSKSQILGERAGRILTKGKLDG